MATVDINALISKLQGVKGTRYKYGGASTDGFDCSGLIYWGYQQLGITVPRTAEAQRQASTPIDASAIQPGDLIFGYAGEAQASHVVMYIGNNTVISAPRTGEVVKESDATYYLNNALSIGRLTGTVGTYTNSNGNTTRVQINTTRSFKTNPETDWLLEPTDDERKYGINIYDGEQPLIKFSTSAGILGSGNAVEALKKYAEFLFYLLNSEMSTAQVVCLSMPWIRPGFNVWYDPIYSDTIYYCTNVTHQGDPTNGATTELSLILGRNRENFVNSVDSFGSMKDRSDNVMMNSYVDGCRVKDFGPCVQSEEEFNNIGAAFKNYYGSPSFETMDAEDSTFHKNMYVDGDDASPMPENIDSDKVFSKSYTRDEIESQLASLYSKAPEVIKNRSKKLKGIIQKADEFMEKYHLQGG